MNEKVKRWLHRVVEEKLMRIKLLSDEISILNHQIRYFDQMHPNIQLEVIEGLKKSMLEFKWEEEVGELDGNNV